MLADEIRVSIEDGEEFEPFEDLVERRVRRVIDFSTVDPPQTVTVGEVAIRGAGEDATIDELDLQQGIDRLGALEEPADLEPVAPEREQERLEDISPANQLADRVIALQEQ